MNSVLNDFLDKFDLEDVEAVTNVPRRDLVMFTMNLFRQVVLLERDNVGSPGKAAIEYLLNQKYEIIENKQIPKNMQLALLKEVDNVISKVVAKYQIHRKGRNFYFDEAMSIVITAPDKICDTEDQLIANIYAAQSELEALRVQLTRTNLQNTSQTLLVKKAVIEKELEIQRLKKQLTSFRKFDSVTDQNALYRRSIGEAKKETATGASLGASIGSTIASHRFKKKVNFDKKLADFQQANKQLKDAKQQIRGLRAEAKHLRSGEPSTNKSKKLEKITQKVTNLVKNQKELRKAVDKGGKKVVGLTREAIKRGLKGSAIGAATGAAAGLGVYAAHKAMNNESLLSSKLYTALNKLTRIPITEDSDDYRSTKRLYKTLDGVYRRGSIAKYQNNLAVLGKNKGFRVASIASALLLGAAGITFILKRAREKGPDQVKNSIRSTQYKARNSKTLTSREKMLIQNNGKQAIQRIDQVFKNNKRR